MRYLAYGHVIASNCALPCLPPSRRDPPDITIELSAEPAVTPERRTAPIADVDRWLHVARTAEGYVLRLATAVTCAVTPDGRAIRVHHDGSLTDTIQHLIVDQVLPLVIAHRGHLVLHGAGLSVGGHGVAFIGPSGAGKSTLAAILASRGATVVADDALVVAVDAARARAHPAYPGVRLWPDVLTAIGVHDGGGSVECVASVAADTEKRRVDLLTAGAVIDGALVLDRVYVVDPEPVPAMSIVPLSKRDAVMALLTHSYVLDASDTPRLRQSFGQACAMVERSVVRRLRYPRDLARLPDLCAALDDDLRS